MRFGLDRMRRLMTALGHPERQFDSIHVVGTNGKSSTSRMIAAILERHGLRTGAYLSPHLSRSRERIRIGDARPRARARSRPRSRAPRAPPSSSTARSAGDDRVTQFEALTAAALLASSRARGVEVAVIEAGLGGRYDATNVIPSTVQVLTSVGLEHTRWLGPTIDRHRAARSSTSCSPAATLVLGAGLDPDALAVAERDGRASAARRSSTPAPTRASRVARARHATSGATSRSRAPPREAFLGAARRRTRSRAAAADVRVPGPAAGRSTASR